MLISMPTEPAEPAEPTDPAEPARPAEPAGAADAPPSSSPAGPDYGATLWTPGPGTIEKARITHFANWLTARHGLSLPGYDELWQWSVTEPADFWASVWDYFEVLGERGDGPVLSGGPMPDVSWFAGTTLNYARNALRTARTEPDRTAVIYRSEAGRNGTLSYGELDRQVATARAALRALGVTKGDRVAAYLPNIPQALIGLLATASLGAIWSSCSPDFGAPSVIDRFAQISPKVLIAVDGYVYGGKTFDRQHEVAVIAAALPSLTAVIMVDYVGAPAGEQRSLPLRMLDWDALGEVSSPGGQAQDSQAQGSRAGETEFDDVPFGHPLWVLYSSGTTGLPKPIVHGHGGIVLEHLKALAFHQDLTSDDIFFWYTTTGWMMWNYLAGGLLAGAAVVLYDGSAVYPGTGALWRLIAETGVTYAGTGAPYLLACRKEGLRPGAEHDLSALRGIGSTGSPLPPEGFSWVYDEVAGPARDLVLGSFSGGTDLCTGFVGPCPLLPVRSGLIAGPCLGAKVEAFDAAGQPVTGQVGELVITAPMPSMPVGFWGDDDGERYRASYFADFPGVWRHGDWIMMLPGGGCVIYGRSDATLNRGGVRMGTSEFYRVVERLPEIADSLVVDTGKLGQPGRLILYLVPVAGQEVDDELTGRIRSALRTELSPRHVPDEIHQVPGIPRTLSGKKLEVPVRRILMGTPVPEAADPDALANPEVLSFFVPGGPQ
jgi:acetoacetyl-CoA synthetase